MSLTLLQIAKPVSGEIKLPSSKSISNRVLIIQALSEKKFQIKNISDSDDSQNLIRALELKSNTIDAGEGGTTFRFLLAYLACTNGEWKLTGNKRLFERPLIPLIDALKKLGAEIQPKKNFISIRGKELDGGKISIDASISSQFISALLLVAPRMKNGLQLTLKGKTVSMPYIEMTMQLMQQFGGDVKWNGNTISVAKGNYSEKKFSVEADWSATSYFYELVAQKPKSKLLLRGLKKNSLQGDSIVAEIFEAFGVKTTFNSKGAVIENNSATNAPMNSKQHLIFDLKDTPDLFPALVVTCAACGISATFKNISHLNSKESERANVFEKILSQLGCKVKQAKNIFSISGCIQPPTINHQISTYNDHRIAMSLAPLASILPSVEIENENVVNKSFPHFWEEFLKVSKS
ncbi:MAG TPA: 3-phosphoshikimate 1-carboxyvinyltransferase [Bacteroidetes bacterium]|nr:3-phosphoshikimate 1-carboxyvinyltransferase [Bacteroidota bacterium]